MAGGREVRKTYLGTVMMWKLYVFSSHILAKKIKSQEIDAVIGRTQSTLNA